jgi:hypothetical protein
VRRATVTHNISFTAKPQAHNTILSPGSIVRVIFARESNSDAPSVHNYFYRVERITKTLTGEIGYECSHFPIDSEGRSIISLYVASAVGNGALFTSNQTGVTCDLPGREDDFTIPVEEFLPIYDIPGWEFDPGTGEWIPDTDIPGWDWDDETGEWVLDPLEPFPDPQPDPPPDYPPIDVFDPPIDLDTPGPGDGDIGDGADIGGGIGGIGGIGGGGGGGEGDPTEDNPQDPLDPQDEPPVTPDPFAGYPKPGDANYPPDPPAGIEPTLMGNGQPAPGPAPTEWNPGTWYTILQRDAFTVELFEIEGGQCVVDRTAPFSQVGPTNISGPCWGLYKVVTPGTCGEVVSITWHTAVIGNGFSYWYQIGSAGGNSPEGGTGYEDYTLTNVFTPV